MNALDVDLLAADPNLRPKLVGILRTSTWSDVLDALAVMAKDSAASKDDYPDVARRLRNMGATLEEASAKLQGDITDGATLDIT